MGAAVSATILMRRYGADDVAPVMQFLASDQNSYCAVRATPSMAEFWRRGSREWWLLSRRPVSVILRQHRPNDARGKAAYTNLHLDLSTASPENHGALYQPFGACSASATWQHRDRDLSVGTRSIVHDHDVECGCSAGPTLGTASDGTSGQREFRGGDAVGCARSTRLD
jgi:hypothetical protein